MCLLQCDKLEGLGLKHEGKLIHLKIKEITLAKDKQDRVNLKAHALELEKKAWKLKDSAK
jgi:hypothetical protein